MNHGDLEHSRDSIIVPDEIGVMGDIFPMVGDKQPGHRLAAFPANIDGLFQNVI